MLRILLANFFLGFDSGPAWICSVSAGESWCGGWWRWWSWWPEMEVCFRLETNLSSSPLWREDLWLLPALTQWRENIYLILFEIILFIVLTGLHLWIPSFLVFSRADSECLFMSWEWWGRLLWWWWESRLRSSRDLRSSPLLPPPPPPPPPAAPRFISPSSSRWCLLWDDFFTSSEDSAMSPKVT